jgi:hypothetical protein
MRAPLFGDRFGWQPFWVELLGWLLPLLLFGLLAGLAVWALLRLGSRRAPGPGGTAGWGAWQGSPPPPAAPRHDPALEAARMRYAQGSISREEYFQIVHDLGGEAPPPPPHASPPPSQHPTVPG